MVVTRITRLKSWLVFGYYVSCDYDKICEHRVVNNTFLNFATDWEKRDRSAVFNALLVVFLWIGTTFPSSHSDEKMSSVRHDLKIVLRGLQMELSHNLNMPILIISSPWALFESSLLMFLISSTEKSTSNSDLSVIKGKSGGNVLPLSINEHCFVKKELKILLFSLNLVINLLSWISGGIQDES